MAVVDTTIVSIAAPSIRHQFDRRRRSHHGDDRLILLIFSMTSAPRHGWLAPETWSAGLLGLVAMILFVVIERHHADPLVPPAIVAKTAVLAPNGQSDCSRPTSPI